MTVSRGVWELMSGDGDPPPVSLEAGLVLGTTSPGRMSQGCGAGGRQGPWEELFTPCSDHGWGCHRTQQLCQHALGGLKVKDPCRWAEICRLLFSYFHPHPWSHQGFPRALSVVCSSVLLPDSPTAHGPRHCTCLPCV